MENVFDICSYFIRRGINSNNPISNVTIQKLLYFAQGFHLAEGRGCLFSNPIYAWEFGPVVRDVYHHFKEFGNDSITSENFNLLLGDDFLNRWENLSPESVQFLEQIWETFREYRPFELVELTHVPGSPWYLIYQQYGRNIPRNVRINEDDMRAYFTSIIAA